MNRKTLILIFLFIAVPPIVYFVVPTDTARIKKLIKEGGKAVEEKNIENVMGCVSPAYRDDYGLTYLYVKENFKRLFRLYSAIKVDYEKVEIGINDTKAVAELDVRVIVTSGNNAGYLVGVAAYPEHIVFHLEKERLKWLITKTEGFSAVSF